MSTARRISVLSRILNGHKLAIHRTVSNADGSAIRHYSSEFIDYNNNFQCLTVCFLFLAGGKITIGDVAKELKVPKQPAYVPINYSKLQIPKIIF